MKKKLGIALRRYLFTDVPCKKSAKYFGCSREFLRAFLRAQFVGRMHWIDYGKTWCIGHVLPVHLFGNTEAHLKQCWNWANLRVVPIQEQRTSLSRQQARQIFVKLLEDMTSLKNSSKGNSFPDMEQLNKLMEKFLSLSPKEKVPEIGFRDALKREMRGVG